MPMAAYFLVDPEILKHIILSTYDELTDKVSNSNTKGSDTHKQSVEYPPISSPNS